MLIRMINVSWLKRWSSLRNLFVLRSGNSSLWWLELEWRHIRTVIIRMIYTKRSLICLIANSDYRDIGRHEVLLIILQLSTSSKIKNYSDKGKAQPVDLHCLRFIWTVFNIEEYTESPACYWILCYETPYLAKFLNLVESRAFW